MFSRLINVSRRARVLPLMLLALATLGAAPGASAGSARAFSEVPADIASALAPVDNDRPAVVRSRFVRLDRAALPAVEFGADVAARLAGPANATLNFFDDLSLDVVFDRVEPGARGLSPDSYTLCGRLADSPHNGVFISVNGDAVAGEVIASDSHTLQLRGTPLPGILEVVDIARPLLDPCGTHKAFVIGDGVNPEPPVQRLNGEGLGPVVDVLVVYTPWVSNHGGGDAGVEAFVASWFSVVNQAFASSGVNQRVRLVHIQRTEYIESPSGSGTDLSRLRSNGDGHMDEVHTLRNTYGADIVHLVSNSGGVCGQAYLMSSVGPAFASSAFGLTVLTCGAFTFAHELGHNMGCAHDRENGGGGAYCYSFGFRHAGQPQYRTIMSYEPGTEVPYFSSPNVVFNGVTLGFPGDGCPPNGTDNARTISNTSATSAAFRATVVPNPAPDPFNLVSPPNGQAGVAPAPALSWQASAGATQYHLTLSLNPDASNPFYVRKGLLTTTAFIPAGTLSGATTYYWAVTATGIGTQRASTPAVGMFRTAPLGDFNGDGTVGSTDLGILLGSWGPCPVPPLACPADLNGDGVVNSGDLAALLGSWGTM